MSLNRECFLAIDSACSILSIALSCGDDIHYIETDGSHKQSEIVMELIDSQIKKAGLQPKDISCVLCMGGPGSFTGLRIGYSIAKGLALSLSIPFRPIPTLDCISLNHTQENDSIVIPIIESGKNAYYYTFFQNNQRLAEVKNGDFLKIKDEILIYLKNKDKKIIITGPGSSIFFNSLPEELKKVIFLSYTQKGYARELITIAKNYEILDNDYTLFLTSGPEYIRQTDAEAGLARRCK